MTVIRGRIVTLLALVGRGRSGHDRGQTPAVAQRATAGGAA
jgi:hypothetical protein